MELSQETIMVITAVVALIIAVVALVRRGKPVDMPTALATLQESTSTAKELTEVALTAARAAEQLYRSGKITRDDRLTHAFEYVERWFGNELDDDAITTAIESAVLVVNAMTKSIPPKQSAPTAKSLIETLSARGTLPTDEPGDLPVL